MIALLHRFSSGGDPPLDALRDALARYEAHPVQSTASGATLALAGHRDSCAKRDERVVALSGWIDNAEDLERALGHTAENPAALYADCLEQWGDDADERVIGSYTAATRLGDGSVRLSRSPWNAPPLYYHVDGDRLVASPLLRALFAAGAPREADYERIVDQLAWDYRSLDEQSWYRGIAMVPLGAFIRFAADGTRSETVRWYRPPAPMQPGDYEEDTAVDRARELLDEAAAKALAWAGKPALAMSGGLDSTLVANASVCALAEGEKLVAVTFGPDRRWNGEQGFGTMGDERQLAQLMAEANPALDWHQTRDDHGPHDRRAREIFAASEVFAPGLANVGMYHNLYDRARELGCDSLLTADYGNVTISDAGRSAYAEYARRGEWRQLVRLLQSRPGDHRPLWRKLIATSLLPHLPRTLRWLARRVVHPRRADMPGLFSPLSAKALAGQRQRAAERQSESAWADFTHDRSRAETVQREWRDADGSGRDVDLAFEQLYGIRKRDVLTYRPLVEFCMSLPTRAFAWDGEERRLARLIGRGRIPDAIRTNRLHGQHNVDWHARMTPALGEMRETLERARSHPFLVETLDIDRLQAMIDSWPESPDFSWERDWPLRLALPRAILAARFIGHLENRNEF